MAMGPMERMNRMAESMRETPEEKRAKYLAEADALQGRSPALAQLLRQLADMDGPDGNGGGGNGAPPPPSCGDIEA